MNPQPKPFKRAEKRCKPISRRARLKRGKPPAKRSAKRYSVERRDADWSETVRWRDGFCRLQSELGCQAMPTDAHHVMGKKAHPRLRHELPNGLGLCRVGHQWAHAHPRQFKAWFAEKYPQAWAYIQSKVRS